ncbi:MAG: metal-dependent transcriptional regulator [Clostridia bacterium]|nr:metal-dependent transcriptional regulator [Clostridia bacterium]
MHLQESGEMYLETIYILSKKHGTVRSIDVCEYMGFSKPSVSRAVGILKNGGYVTSDADGFLSLTDAGLEVAQKIYERHTMLTNYLIRLGVSEKTAEMDACKMEHDISDETFEAMKRHAKKHENNRTGDCKMKMQK